MITLKQSIVDQIRSDKTLKILVQGALNISHTTLYKYLDLNDSALTNANVLKVLKENTSHKTDKELLSA